MLLNRKEKKKNKKLLIFPERVCAPQPIFNFRYERYEQGRGDGHAVPISWPMSVARVSVCLLPRLPVVCNDRGLRPPTHIDLLPTDEAAGGGDSTEREQWGSGGGGAHFTDSVYMWACGDKSKDQKEGLKTSDVVIGWLVLLVRIYDTW